MPLNHTSEYAELTNEQFALIGRLVIEWSNIEFLLGVLLSRLLFMPEFVGRVWGGAKRHPKSHPLILLRGFSTGSFNVQRD
jgi:hypothetical protein